MTISLINNKPESIALTQVFGYVSLLVGCTFLQPLGSGRKWLLACLEPASLRNVEVY